MRVLIKNWIISSNIKDKKKYEEFLKFIEKTANNEIRQYLIDEFEISVTTQKLFKNYLAKDVQSLIKETIKNDKLKDYFDKFFIYIQENEAFDRLQDIFLSTPIKSSDLFFASTINVNSTKYKNIIKENVNIFIRTFSVFILSLFLGLTYVIFLSKLRK